MQVVANEHHEEAICREGINTSPVANLLMCSISGVGCCDRFRRQPRDVHAEDILAAPIRPVGPRTAVRPALA